MIPVEVSTRLGKDNQQIPMSFQFQDSFYRVDQIIREWRDQDGRHLLVGVSSGTEAFELLVDPAGHWFMVKGHDRPTVTIP